MRKSISEILAEKRTAGNESGGSMQEMMQRGIAASEAGDKQTANAIFRQVAQQYPDNVEVWVWLGWSSSNMDEAEGAFTRAAELDPSNEEVALGLRWVMSQRAAEPPPPPAETPAPQPVQQTWQQEQPAAQVAPTTSAASVSAASAPQFDLSPSSPPLLEDDLPPRPIPTRSVSEMLQQAIKTVQSGDKATAYRMFEHILSVRAGDPDIWVWLGGTSSTLEDAESAFRRAREIDPFNEKATLGLRWVTLRRQVAYAAALPSASALTPEPASEPAPRKENVFSRFFKRFTRSS